MVLSIFLDIHVHIQAALSRMVFGRRQLDVGLRHDTGIRMNGRTQVFGHIIPNIHLPARRFRNLRVSTRQALYLGVVGS